MDLATQLTDLRVSIEQVLCGDPADCQDNARLKQGDLPFQERTATGRFSRCGVAVVRWPTFEDSGDKDLLTLEADSLEHRVQEFAGPTDERFTLSLIHI